jgi:hypothetical protein
VKKYVSPFCQFFSKNFISIGQPQKSSIELSKKHPSPKFQITIGALSISSLIHRCFGKKLRTIFPYETSQVPLVLLKFLKYHGSLKKYAFFGIPNNFSIVLKKLNS